MTAQAPSIQELDAIVNETVRAVDRARDQIFVIAESARAEYDHVQAEVAQAKFEADELIRLVDSLERREQAARKRLATVSRDFKAHGEQEIKDAYDSAREYGVQLQVARERERHLRRRRDELEVRLKHLESTVKRAEELVSHVGIAMDFLSGKLRRLSQQFNDIQQKRDLGLSIIRAQEEERRRLARDIHDGPAQLLANVVLRVDLCQRLVDVDADRIRSELDQLKDLVRQSLKDVRKIIFDLRPMALDDLGLIPALRTYLKDVEERSGLTLETLVLGEERRLDPALEVAIFRFVQEAASNVVRHASARTLWVKIELTADSVRAIVRDDGCGFNPTTASDGGRYGLLNMRERVELLNGQFSINTSPGRGTRIEVAIPTMQPRGGGQ